MVTRLMFVETRLMPRGAAAFTAWPFCFVSRGVVITPDLRAHEGTHGWQQVVAVIISTIVAAAIGLVFTWPPQPATFLVSGVWVLEGYGLGHLAWRWLYLVGFPFGLPVGWNPFRAWVEKAAYRAEGRLDSDIRKILRRAPYYLWWG